VILANISHRDRLVLVTGFAAGLLVRIAMLLHPGMYDMNQYHAWGQEALASSLPQTFHGIYFPVQYQIFIVAAWITNALGVDFWIVFKAFNLVFDIASFVVILALLERMRARPTFALLYWGHPWLLAVFSLGYVDFQFTFFVLLSLLLLRNDTARSYALAGVPLGVAFLMKPQAQVLIVAAFAFAVFRSLRRRDLRPFAILAGSVILFFVYEAYFTAALWSARGIRAVIFLPEYYQGVTNVMPCLTADMLNLWYPVAYFLKEPGAEIFTVTDQYEPFLGIPTKHFAGAAVIGLVVWSASRFERDRSADPSTRLLYLFAFASVVVPFIMTSGHENHLFLGSVLLVLCLANGVSLWTHLAAHVLLAVQFLNITGRVAQYPAWLAEILTSIYSQEVALVYALISIPCFMMVLRTLIGRAPITRSG
jgi:hypothetical protein